MSVKINSVGEIVVSNNSITVFGSRVLVKKVKNTLSEVNGIYIGEQKQREDVALIIGVGDQVDVDKFNLGDHVLFETHRGTLVNTEEGDAYILETVDIIGKIIYEEDSK